MVTAEQHPVDSERLAAVDVAVSSGDASPQSRLYKNLHWLILLVVALMIPIGITSGELHFNGDEMRHGVTGIFFRDLMVDRPFNNPIQYAYEYYSKYPALGVPHWPPFFYFVEGVFFLIFGIDAWVSRFTVFCFAMLGAYFWYRIAEREGPRHRALFAAFMFPLVPYVLLYERATMLEIPMIALSLGALHFWRSFLEHERRRDIFLVGLFVALALLTSQKAIVLAPFLILHFLVERRWRLLARWDVWASAIAAVAVVAPWYWLSFGTVALTYERAVGQSAAHVSRWIHWWYYPYHVRYQIGILLTALAAGGIVWALLRAPRRHRFMLLWVAVTYVTYSLIQEKDLRHTMIWIPALVYFALLAVEAVMFRRRWAYLGLTVLAAFTFYKAWNYQRPKIGGVEDAVKYVMAQPESDVLYYQGSLNGDFIFYVRKHDPEKRHLVARDKLIVATKIVQAFGTRSLVTDADEVVELFRTWGIRYVVLQNRDDMVGLGIVHRAVNAGQFDLVREFPLWSNADKAHDYKVRVYRYKGELRRSTDPVTLPMMTLSDDIKVDLSKLAGKPWP